MFTYWVRLCFCAIRREIQRLQNEHEELVRNLGVSSTDTSVFQDLRDMLVCRDAVDEETKAEKGKVAFLKEQVKYAFLWQLSEHHTMNSSWCSYLDALVGLCFQILRWERKLAAQRISGGATCCKSDNSSLLKKTCRVENKLSRVSVTQRILFTIKKHHIFLFSAESAQTHATSKHTN